MKKSALRPSVSVKKKNVREPKSKPILTGHLGVALGDLLAVVTALLETDHLAAVPLVRTVDRREVTEVAIHPIACEAVCPHHDGDLHHVDRRETAHLLVAPGEVAKPADLMIGHHQDVALRDTALRAEDLHHVMHGAADPHQEGHHVTAHHLVDDHLHGMLGADPRRPVVDRPHVTDGVVDHLPDVDSAVVLPRDARCHQTEEDHLVMDLLLGDEEETSRLET